MGPKAKAKAKAGPKGTARLNAMKAGVKARAAPGRKRPAGTVGAPMKSPRTAGRGDTAEEAEKRWAAGYSVFLRHVDPREYEKAGGLVVLEGRYSPQCDSSWSGRERDHGWWGRALEAEFDRHWGRGAPQTPHWEPWLACEGPHLWAGLQPRGGSGGSGASPGGSKDERTRGGRGLGDQLGEAERRRRGRASSLACPGRRRSPGSRGRRRRRSRTRSEDRRRRRRTEKEEKEKRQEVQEEKKESQREGRLFRRGDTPGWNQTPSGQSEEGKAALCWDGAGPSRQSEKPCGEESSQAHEEEGREEFLQCQREPDAEQLLCGRRRGRGDVVRPRVESEGPGRVPSGCTGESGVEGDEIVSVAGDRDGGPPQHPPGCSSGLFPPAPQPKGPGTHSPRADDTVSRSRPALEGSTSQCDGLHDPAYKIHRTDDGRQPLVGEPAAGGPTGGHSHVDHSAGGDLGAERGVPGGQGPMVCGLSGRPSSEGRQRSGQSQVRRERQERRRRRQGEKRRERRQQSRGEQKERELRRLEEKSAGVAAPEAGVNAPEKEGESTIEIEERAYERGMEMASWSLFELGAERERGTLPHDYNLPLEAMQGSPAKSGADRIHSPEGERDGPSGPTFSSAAFDMTRCDAVSAPGKIDASVSLGGKLWVI